MDNVPDVELWVDCRGWVGGIGDDLLPAEPLQSHLRNRPIIGRHVFRLVVIWVHAFCEVQGNQCTYTSGPTFLLPSYSYVTEWELIIALQEGGDDFSTNWDRAYNKYFKYLQTFGHYRFSWKVMDIYSTPLTGQHVGLILWLMLNWIA